MTLPPLRFGTVRQLGVLGSKSPFLPDIDESRYTPTLVMGNVNSIQSEPFERRAVATIELLSIGGQHAWFELGARGGGGIVVEALYPSFEQAPAPGNFLSVVRSSTPSVVDTVGATQAPIAEIGGVDAQSVFWGANKVQGPPFNIANVPGFPLGAGNFAPYFDQRIFVPAGEFLTMQISQLSAAAKLTVVWREIEEAV